MRVGLIAMSGVRVVNPELAALGVTLPQFLDRGHVIATLPSLGLLAIAAVFPEDVEVEYIEVADLSVDVRTDFDLVGISSFTALAYDMYELADRYRAAGIPVVLGGIHVSQVPDEAAPHADAVCVGEGELLWPKLLADFKAGGREGLKPVYREEKPGTYDLADCPIPRYDLLPTDKYNRITVQTVRGCPFDCEFCGASKLFGPKYRKKPVPNIVAEIEAIQARFGKNAFIEFADDNSFADPKHTRELLEAIKDHGIRWFTETDISVGEHPDLLKLLHQSGCRQILVGLESPCAASLEGIDRAGWKRKQLDRYKGAIDRIQSAGVTVNGCFIVGNDGDDESVFDEIQRFVEETQLIECQVTILTPFPGTRLLKRLEDEGRLLYERFWDRCTLFDLVFKPKQMTPERLVEGHMELMKELYAPEKTQHRRRHYIDIVKALLPN